MTPPITDLRVLVGRDAAVPDRYVRLPVDLNRRAGGAYVYLCYARDPSLGDPIRDVRAEQKESGESTDGWQPVLQSASEGAATRSAKANVSQGTWTLHAWPPGPGPRIAVLFTCAGPEDPIADLVVQASALDNQRPPLQGYRRTTSDLNRGAGGDYVYVYASRSPHVPVPSMAEGWSDALVDAMAPDHFASGSWGREYEVERLQVAADRLLRRSKRLYKVGDYSQGSVGAIELQWALGETRERVDQLTSELKVEGGLKHGGLGVTVGKVLRSTQTDRVESTEQRTHRREIKVGPEQVDRTLRVVQLVDTLQLLDFSNRELARVENRSDDVRAFWLT